jgi:hypothetical protein
VPNITDDVAIPVVTNHPVTPAPLALHNLSVTGTLNNATPGTVITLTGNLTVSGTWQSAGNSTVVMKTDLATIDSTVGLGSLTIDPGVGKSVKLSGSDLSMDGDLLVTSGGSLDLNGKKLTMTASAQMSGTVTNTGGAAVFDASAGTLTLAGTTTITTNSGNVTLGSVTGAEGLSITAGTGALSASGAIGTTALGSLTVVSSGTTSLKSVTTSGAQSYTAGTSITLNGTYQETTSGGGNGISFSGPVLLAGGSVVTAANNDVTFGSTVDDNQSLSVGAGNGAVAFQGAVGTTALAGLTVV